MNWIPTTDRLPPHGVEVLVTLASVRKGAKSKVAIGARWDANGRGHCGDAGWSMDGDDINTPLAWMPLPLPFNAPAQPLPEGQSGAATGSAAGDNYGE